MAELRRGGLVGTKVRLRALERADLEQLRAWVNDPEVMRFWSTPPWTTWSATSRRHPVQSRSPRPDPAPESEIHGTPAASSVSPMAAWSVSPGAPIAATISGVVTISAAISAARSGSPSVS